MVATSFDRFPRLNNTPRSSEIEKLETAAASRGPWERGRRCVIPANGFYEWHLGSDGAKNPYLTELADPPLFGFPGLFDGSRREDGTVVRSCTIVTLPAWLSGTAKEARGVLQQYPDDWMHAYIE